VNPTEGISPPTAASENKRVNVPAIRIRFMDVSF
jgi:hypothetical protein